jgi:hypothetical protein
MYDSIPSIPSLTLGSTEILENSQHRRGVTRQVHRGPRAARQMADLQRCGQIDLDLLAISRNAKGVASADGECEGADKQAPAPTSCSLYLVRNLQRNARGSYRSRISHPGARSLLRRPGAGRYYRRKQGSAKTNKRHQRFRSRCACLLTCGAGTGSIQSRSTLSSSTASQ